MEFDFHAAEQIGQRLEELVHQMSFEILDEFEEIVWELSKGWSGETGECFQKIGAIETAKMREVVQHLKCAENAVHDAVILAKQLEEETEEIARSRTY